MEQFTTILGDVSIVEIVNFVIWGFVFLVLIIKFFGSIRLVPTQSAYIVERLGKYHKTLGPGFHAMIPFLDRVAFIQDLKEQTIEVPPQECFTKDEVRVEVDGVMYLSVVDPVRASYGATSYPVASMELAQTTTRSVIGTLQLDQTFEERDLISSRVVEVLTAAGETWGVRVHRYEIKNLTPPPTVHEAMERQVTAERERRAIVARAEGKRQAQINKSEGQKLEAINLSEGQMQRLINEAQGTAEQILAIAKATASSIEKVASAIVGSESGEDSVRLQLAERYLQRLTALADKDTKIVLPADLTNLDDLLQVLDFDGFANGRKPAGPAG